MEVDLQSLFGLHWGFMSRDVYSCTHWLRSRNPLYPPRFGTRKRALLVSKDRRHLFVSPWEKGEKGGGVDGGVGMVAANQPPGACPKY
jgi:hypothetical protein